MDKETSIPKQNAEDGAKFYKPELGRSIVAKDQAEADKKFKELLGEERKTTPTKLTTKPTKK